MILVYYHNDMDGYAGASVYKSEMCKGKDVRFFPVEHGMSEPSVEDVTNETEVFIVDYSYTKDTIKQLYDICNIASKVTWIDHHVSSLAYVNSIGEYNDNNSIYCYKGALRDYVNLFTDNLDVYINTAFCGAVLSAAYWMKENGNKDIDLWNNNKITGAVYDRYNYLCYVDSWDTWKRMLLPEEIYFKYGLEAMSPWDLNIKNNVFDKLNDDKIDIEMLIDNGRIIYDYVMKRNRANFHKGYFAKLDGNPCYVINSIEHNSYVFGDRFNERDFAELFVIWHYSDCGLITYSIYTNNKAKYDCAKIAEKFGGGGHPGAAGFSMYKYVLEDNGTPIFISPAFSGETK